MEAEEETSLSGPRCSVCLAACSDAGRRVCESSGCRGARQLIKLSFWVHTGVVLASLDLDMSRVKLHATRQTTRPCSPPDLSPPHYVLNLLVCTNSGAIITSLHSLFTLGTYSTNPQCVCQGMNTKHFPSFCRSLLRVFTLYVNPPHTHTFVLYCASLFPPSLCDLHILSGSSGYCSLFSVSRWGTREQAKRTQEREGGRDGAKEERWGGGMESSSGSHGPVAAGADRGAGGDLQRQFWV